WNARVVQVGIAVGPPLARVVEVVGALVAGEVDPLVDARADQLVGRPVLRPPVQRREGIVPAEGCDVVAVLVRDDVLARVWRPSAAGIRAGYEHAPLPRDVAGLHAGVATAGVGDLDRGPDEPPQLTQLGP